MIPSFIASCFLFLPLTSLTSLFALAFSLGYFCVHSCLPHTHIHTHAPHCNSNLYYCSHVYLGNSVRCWSYVRLFCPTNRLLHCHDDRQTTLKEKREMGSLYFFIIVSLLLSSSLLSLYSYQAIQPFLFSVISPFFPPRRRSHRPLFTLIVFFSPSSPFNSL